MVRNWPLKLFTVVLGATTNLKKKLSSKLPATPGAGWPICPAQTFSIAHNAAEWYEAW